MPRPGYCTCRGCECARSARRRPHTCRPPSAPSAAARAVRFVNCFSGNHAPSSSPRSTSQKVRHSGSFFGGRCVSTVSWSGGSAESAAVDAIVPVSRSYSEEGKKSGGAFTRRRRRRDGVGSGARGKGTAATTLSKPVAPETHGASVTERPAVARLASTSVVDEVAVPLVRGPRHRVDVSGDHLPWWWMWSKLLLVQAWRLAMPEVGTCHSKILLGCFGGDGYTRALNLTSPPPATGLSRA